MPRHNKQHAPRAASFRRIAMQLRAEAKSLDGPPIAKKLLRIQAKAHDDEARLLRTMR